MTKCKVIALANQKGGTAKTTTTLNLGIGLAHQGRKVLLVDADPQGDLTTALGWINADSLPITLETQMKKILQDEPFVYNEGILHHEEGVDIIPTNIELSGMEISLVNAMSREQTLKLYLSDLKKDYDYILIDCMPSLGMLTINVLAAADSVIVPVQAHYLPLKGMTQLMKTIGKVQRQLNPSLKIDGVLLTLADMRTKLARTTEDTRTHDSLKISNGKWMWWSQRTGGRSALDYLIKVRGYSFLEAVEMLAERANIQPSLSVSENVPMEKQLLLPKKNQDDQKVIAYLLGRGIDKEIIQFCLESGRVYESAFHHNVVFVGMDEKDNPKYAAIRGTGSSFIGEANGSDKNYSFSIFTEKSCDMVHLFESAIDLLSYATLLKLDGKEWRREHLLSLAGVYQPAKEIEKSKVPAALARALKMHPEMKTIVLHLDNDRIGRLATKAISAVLPKQYQVKDVPPKQGKDYNDLLCIKLNLAITKREKNTKKSMSGHEKYER